jgi:hypothetical protein
MRAGAQPISRTRIMFGGIYLSYKFFREIVRRATGVPAEAPLLAALFAVGVVVKALARLAAPAFKPLRPKPPSAPGVLAAVAVPSAIISRATGVPARDATIVSGAIATGAALPTVRILVALARLVPAALGEAARFATGRPRERA